jgi:tRNA uridine 5-carbamoylmethylation protein Kti12
MNYYIIIRGPLGCGKSTISEKLAKIIKAKYFAIDRVLDEGHFTLDEEDGYVSQNSFKKANEVIAPKAMEVLKNNKPVIFDGNFYWQSQIDDLIAKLDFPHYVFTLQAPLELCIERDAQRDKPHGQDAAKAVYKKSTEFTYGTEIDVTKNLEQCIEEILSYLPKK